MTFIDVVSTCLRRWPIVMIGLLLTALALIPVRTTPGVYWAQADVVLLAPRSPNVPNSLSVSSTSLIALAGVVERRYNNGKEDPATASSQVTLVDQGVTDGVSVELPNAGGQYNTYYSKPVLYVQAAGPSAGDVQRTLTVVVARLRSMLQQTQADMRVIPANQVSAEVSPRTPEILYSAGARNQAALLVIMVGIGVTISCAVIVDQLLRRRRAVPSNSPALDELHSSATGNESALAGTASGPSRAG